MKKFSLIMLALMLVLLTAVPASALDVHPGDTVTYDIYFFNSTRKAIAAEIWLKFDKSVFDLVSLKGTYSTYSEYWENVTKPGDDPSIFAANKYKLPLSNATCGKITLRVKQNAKPGKYSIYPVSLGLDKYKNDAPVSATILSDDNVINVVKGCTEHILCGESTIKEPTCTEPGEMIQICTVCGEIVVRKEIPALGHKPGEWEITKEPTASEAGERVKKCTVCHEIVERESIPPTLKLLGDVNNDGTVDGRDTLRLLKYLSGQSVTINETNSDVNSDGSIDGRDTIRLLKLLAQ